MKRLIPVIFVLAGAALALLFFSRNLFVVDKSISRAKVVVPIVGNPESEQKSSDYSDGLEHTSFIQLSNGETLVGTLEMDIDGDGADDQINMKQSEKQGKRIIKCLLLKMASSRENGLSETHASMLHAFCA